ncbi:MAG: hypothetical protein N2645_13440 [Clostridia bacterium]|nr:hypothetical protein [Clostridia bacterium]
MSIQFRKIDIKKALKYIIGVSILAGISYALYINMYYDDLIFNPPQIMIGDNKSEIQPYTEMFLVSLKAFFEIAAKTFTTLIVSILVYNFILGVFNR